MMSLIAVLESTAFLQDRQILHRLRRELCTPLRQELGEQDGEGSSLFTALPGPRANGDLEHV